MMKQRTYTIMAAALLTAGALLSTACSSEDAVIDNIGQPAEGRAIQFTATLAPKGGASRGQSRAGSNFGEAQPALAEGKGDDGTTTRAITKDKDGENKEILNVAWSEGEEIAVYYEKTDGTFDYRTARVNAVDGETGEASISATLTDAKGGEARFVYPATLHNGEGDIDEQKLLTTQRGILTHSGSGTDYSISKRFDAATATGTIVVTGSGASVSGTLSLTNRVCICKMTFSEEGVGMINALEHVDIHIDGRTYSITPSKYSADKCIYVAMLPVSGSDALFGAYNSGMASGTVTTYGDNYVKLARNVTLEAGKFYRNIPITCVRATEYTGSRTTPILPTLGAVILNNVTVNTSDNAFNIPGSDARFTDNFIIVLKGNNIITSTTQCCAGIFGPSVTRNLTIGGNGSLTATAGPQKPASGERGAAIGGDTGIIEVGTIYIHGTIASLKANGGIGATSNTSCQGVIIDGVANPTSESTYPHLTRSGDTWTHK